MPVVSARTFERWLGRLDAERLRGFVSDLYAESGREVRRREDGALVVGDAERVLVAFEARRRLRTPRVPEDADAVVVAASPSDRLARRVAASGATLVGPSDLRNLALYGVDREDCERLFRRYFGESPSVERPDERADAAGGDGPPGVRASDARTSAVRVSSLVVLVVAGLVVASLFGPFGPGAAPETDDAPDSTGPVVVGAPAGADDEDEGLFPPGIGPTGVVSADELAAAHADAAAERSYELEVRQSGTDAWTGRAWDIVYQRADVASPTRYRYSVTGYRTTEGGDHELVHYSTFADGRNNYVHATNGENRSYVRYAVRTDEDGHGPFENRGARAVERYLDATRTNVTRENWTAHPYRVVATGTPSSVADAENVTDYRAEAYVGPEGFVSHLSVSYDVRTDEGVRSVSFRMQYTETENRGVRAPPWYDEARNATDDSRHGTESTPGNETSSDETPGNETEVETTDAETETEAATKTGMATPASVRAADIVVGARF